MKPIVFSVAMVLVVYCGGHPKNQNIQGNFDSNDITVVLQFNCKINNSYNISKIKYQKQWFNDKPQKSKF